MKVKKTIFKKTVIVTLFLLCLLMLGAVSAADSDAVVGIDVTKETTLIYDADDVGSSLNDDVKSSAEEAQLEASSQEMFINEAQNVIDDNLESSEDDAKLEDANSMSFDELRDEIENAPIGQTITLSKDNYTYGNTSPIKVKDNITIDGNYSWFDGSSANMSGLFCIEGDNVVLKNIFFINWELEDSYNIIEWFGENGTLSNCIFVNSIAIHGCVDWSGDNGVVDGCYFGHDYGMGHGGALCIYSYGTTVKNSEFDNNAAIDNGGAIYSLGESTTITNSTFTNCSSLTGSGGAIYIYSDYNVITDCTFVNSSALDGGAIYVSGNNNIINNSKYFSNEAFNDGGAVFLVGADCCVNNSYFESNRASEDGGAMYAKGTIDFIIDNCTYVNNFAEIDGGAITLEKSAVVNSSIFKNNSALAAGAIFSKDMLDISDSLFDENSAEAGGALVLSDDTEIISSNFTKNIAYNGGAIAIIDDLTLNINDTQFKGNLANLGSNNVVLITNATVVVDNETTSDSPLMLKSVTLSPIYEKNINYGDSLYIVVYVDFGDMPMENGTVLTKLGETYTSPVKDGFAFFNITDLYPGNYNSYFVFTLEGYVDTIIDYNFTVTDNGTGSLETVVVDGVEYPVVYVNGTATVTTKPIPTVIEADYTFTRQANDYSAGERGDFFYAILKDINGNPLSNMSCLVAVNGPIYDVVTDDQGRFGVQVNLAAANTYTYALSFLGNGKYSASFNSTKLILTAKKTSITAKAKTYKVKAKKSFSVTLKTVKNPYDGKTYLKKGKKITLTINGKTYTAKTNAKGVAKFTIKLTKKGKYTAKIKFAGDKTYKASSKSVKITVK